MKKSIVIGLVTVAATICFYGISSAAVHPASDLTNYDFATGDFTGWTTGPGASIVGDNLVHGTSLKSGMITTQSTGAPAADSIATIASKLLISTAEIQGQVASSNATGGSWIYQDVTAHAGDFLMFAFQFYTNEGSRRGSNDTAFLSIVENPAATPTTLLVDRIYDMKNTDNVLNADGVVSTLGAGSLGYSRGTTRKIVYTYQFANAGNYRIGLGIVDDSNTSVLSALVFDDMHVSPIPEPATLFLFGTGLAGLAGLRRKIKK